MNIGWPEGIWLALTFLSLIIVAANHGKPREAYNFPLTLVSFMLSATLLYLGGFFA